MSAFFPESERTYPIDDDHNVTVTALGFEDYMQSSAAARRGSDGDNSTFLALWRIELAKRCVKSWDGPQLDNVPCTAENIAKLSPTIGLKVSDAAIDFNVPREDDDEDGDTEKKE